MSPCIHLLFASVAVPLQASCRSMALSAEIKWFSSSGRAC